VAIGVRPAQPKEAEARDQFVEAHPEGRFCHSWCFRRVLDETYRYRCLYLNNYTGEQRIGVFPSAVVNHGRRRLISEPLNEYGGLLVQNLLVEQFHVLGESLLCLAHNERCESIEIRSELRCALAGQPGSGWVRKPLHSYAILNLENPDHL
jgi:hypothetical protein